MPRLSKKFLAEATNVSRLLLNKSWKKALETPVYRYGRTSAETIIL